MQLIGRHVITQEVKALILWALILSLTCWGLRDDWAEECFIGAGRIFTQEVLNPGWKVLVTADLAILISIKHLQKNENEPKLTFYFMFNSRSVIGQSCVFSSRWAKVRCEARIIDLWFTDFGLEGTNMLHSHQLSMTTLDCLRFQFIQKCLPIYQFIQFISHL